MHGDPGSSDTSPLPGPGGDVAAPVTIPLGGVCPTILAGRDGMPQALCTEYVDRAPTLHLLGGVYAYVDHRDRLVTVDGSLSRSTIGAGPLADTLQMVGTTLPDRTLLQGNPLGLTATRPAG